MTADKPMSDRKKAEQAFREAFEQAEDAIKKAETTARAAGISLRWCAKEKKKIREDRQCKAEFGMSSEEFRRRHVGTAKQHSPLLNG